MQACPLCCRHSTPLSALRYAASLNRAHPASWRAGAGRPTSALHIRALVHPAGQADLLAGLQESAWGVTLDTQLQRRLKLVCAGGKSGLEAGGEAGEG